LEVTITTNRATNGTLRGWKGGIYPDRGGLLRFGVAEFIIAPVEHLMLTVAADSKGAAIDLSGTAIDTVHSDIHANLAVRRSKRTLNCASIPAVGARSTSCDLSCGSSVVDSYSQGLLRFSIAGKIHAPVIDSVNTA